MIGGYVIIDIPFDMPIDTNIKISESEFNTYKAYFTGGKPIFLRVNNETYFDVVSALKIKVSSKNFGFGAESVGIKYTLLVITSNNEHFLKYTYESF